MYHDPWKPDLVQIVISLVFFLFWACAIVGALWLIGDNLPAGIDHAINHYRNA